MTEFKKLLEQAGMSNVNFAKETGQPLRTVQDWSAGTYKAPPAVIWGLKHYIYMTKLKTRIADRLGIQCA